jgi:hypothetical protein
LHSPANLATFSAISEIGVGQLSQWPLKLQKIFPRGPNCRGRSRYPINGDNIDDQILAIDG